MEKCRTCIYKERCDYHYLVPNYYYCSARRSGRTFTGLKKIKLDDDACLLYKKDNDMIKK
jgi:hypothetical protein